MVCVCCQRGNVLRIRRVVAVESLCGSEGRCCSWNHYEAAAVTAHLFHARHPLLIDKAADFISPTTSSG